MNLIGETIGNYRIEKLIGQGTMAEVFHAIHTAKGYPAAIKIIYRHLLNDASFMERFRREAKILSELDHPHIVHIHEYEFRADQAFIVMEYLGGGTLADRLRTYSARKEHMPLAELLQVIEPIASAVDYAHEHGLVHRDLKPANILFREGNDSVLTDFGLAYLMNDPRISTSNTITGTPAYLSPEQAKGMPGDGRSDVYALGVILYELLSGYTPFQGNVVSIVMKHISENPPSIRSFGRYLPKKIEEVVFKALEKQPHQRYQSAQLMVRDLRKVIEKTIPEALALEEAPVDLEWEQAGATDSTVMKSTPGFDSLPAESESAPALETAAPEAASTPPDAILEEAIQDIEAADEANAATPAAEEALAEILGGDSQAARESHPVRLDVPPGRFRPRPTSFGAYDTQEIPRRKRRGGNPALTTAILFAVALILAVLTFVILPQWVNSRPDPNLATAGAPKFTVGQSIQLAIPGGASTSLYDGCRTVFGGNVLGIASDGQKGVVKARRLCGEGWIYQIQVKEAASESWDGIGYVSGNYIK